MLTSFDKIKLFLLSDMIDDILFNAEVTYADKMLYTQISKNVKRITDHISKITKGGDLSLEFDEYKKKAHELIDELMRSST